MVRRWYVVGGTTLQSVACLRFANFHNHRITISHFVSQRGVHTFALHSLAGPQWSPDAAVRRVGILVPPTSLRRGRLVARVVRVRELLTRAPSGAVAPSPHAW